jgi:hypothetical protein
VRLLLAGLAVAIACSGCTVEPPTLEGVPPTPTTVPGALPPAQGPPHAIGPADENGTIAAPPTWTVGQYWRFRSSSGFADDARVVTADAGATYVVDTSSPQSAYFDALSDISTLGPIRKADLAGSQHGSFVEMYRWPLTANTTWTTPWDGVTRTVSVVGPQTALVAGKSYPGMLLAASGGDGTRVSYNFVPAVGWFSFIEFAGQQTFRLDLAEFGPLYNGTIARAKIQELYHDEANGALKPQGSFTVPGSQTFLDALLSARGDQAGYAFSFTTPDNQVKGPFGVGPCGQNCTLAWNQTFTPATPGTWNVATLGNTQGGTVQAHSLLVVRAVEMTERPAR